MLLVSMYVHLLIIKHMTLEWIMFVPILIAVISELLPFLNTAENGLLHGLALGILRTLKNVEIMQISPSGKSHSTGRDLLPQTGLLVPSDESHSPTALALRDGTVLDGTD